MTLLKNIREEIFYIFLLLLGSIFATGFLFNDVPKYLAFDEVEFAKLALSLDHISYAPFSQLATGHSTLYFYILNFSFHVFGINTLALRFPSFIFGILNIVLIFFLLKIVFISDQPKEKLPSRILLITFLSVFISFTSHWYITFARYSFEATFLLFLELSSLLATVQYIKSKKIFYIVLSAICAGLAFNSYTPGRIFFLVPLFLLFFHDFKNKKTFLFFILPFILLVLPLTAYLISHPETRIDELSYIGKPIHIWEKIMYFIQNIKLTLAMFFSEGDLNGRHNYPGKPAMNPLLGILFFIGFLLSIKNFKSSYNKLFLFYFTISIIPALLTIPSENPNMLRTFTILPCLSYFVGQSFLSFSARLFSAKKYIVIIFIICTVSVIYEIRTYFHFQRFIFNKAFEIKSPLDERMKK
ncbi:MAG: glycosyltransferase family 39 protein [bacterium]|nr:glycosyltransferase family 39 protein [bacterium]